LKKDGRRLYELGREGKTDEDVEIEPREVQIHRLELIKGEYPSKFQLEIECGGGTYIRSLVRDIGIALDTVATMTSLERTKQGQFFPEDSLNENDWTAENVYKTIEESKILVTDDDEV
jgi:tRNA pseudouridine55 synthase